MTLQKDPPNQDVKAGLEQTGAVRESAATAAPAPEEKTLAEQVAKLQAENRDLLDTLVRRQADFENYRKRVERERHQERHRGVAALVENLLPVLDAFERALPAHDHPGYEEYRRGIELIERRLWDVLSKQGLRQIEAAGKPFDPHFHHAIERVETDEHPEGTVTEVLQTGYTFHETVLRPAMVRVATRPVHDKKKTEQQAE